MTSKREDREALIAEATIDAIEGLARGATPGPWEAGAVWVYTMPVYPDDNRLSDVLGMKYADEDRADAERDRGLANAAFIAAADPTVVLALIAELRRARAALAVFEQAHTPTDDERARVIAELRWLADARKEYETVTFPEIARQVHTARHLADILERRTPVADGGEGFGWLPSWRWDEWDQMDSRRPVQGGDDR